MPSFLDVLYLCSPLRIILLTYLVVGMFNALLDFGYSVFVDYHPKDNFTFNCFIAIIIHQKWAFSGAAMIKGQTKIEV